MTLFRKPLSLKPTPIVPRQQVASWLVFLCRAVRRDAAPLHALRSHPRRGSSDVDTLAVRANAGWKAGQWQPAGCLFFQPRCGSMKLADTWTDIEEAPAKHTDPPMALS